MAKFNYGSSIISTNLKLQMDTSNPYYTKQREKFQVDLIPYCNGKKMTIRAISEEFKNANIIFAIRKIFREKIENSYIFHKGKRYSLEFKVYEMKDITRYKYKKTDTKIFDKRKKYLLKERINVIAT